MDNTKLDSQFAKKVIKNWSISSTLCPSHSESPEPQDEWQINLINKKSNQKIVYTLVPWRKLPSVLEPLL